jgi:hypothetical protein
MGFWSGKHSDSGWNNTGGPSHWGGWGIANDKVIDRSIGRPWSFWGTDKGKETRKTIKNEQNKAKAGSRERRSNWMWN